MIKAAKWKAKGSVPLLLMMLVFIAPFLISVWTLQNADDLNNRAKGEWLSETIHVPATESGTWQLLWKPSVCNDNCQDLKDRLYKLKLALGKHQTEMEIITAGAELDNQSQSLFVADRKGLVLLAYDANQDGLYKVFKDLKVLMKHGGA